MGIDTIGRIRSRRRLPQINITDADSTVAIILGLGDKQTISVDPQDGRVVLGADVDTEECLQYTPLYMVAGDSIGPRGYEGILLADSNTGPERRRRLAQDQKQAQQPAATDRLSPKILLDALKAAESAGNVVDVKNACIDHTTVVMTRNATVKILIKVASLVSVLPLDAVRVQNGRLLQPVQDLSCSIPPCPYVSGAWNIFEVDVALGEPNTVTNISIGYNAMQPALINSVGLTTAPSNVILASQDSTPPKVSIACSTRWRSICSHNLYLLQHLFILLTLVSLYK